MDYEKLHKDTIAKLQEMVNSGKITVEVARGICAYFVPESDDERIRKRIIQALHGDALDMEETVKAIAWLEKQGEQKPVEPQQDMLSQEKYAKAVDECIYGEQKPAAWSEEEQQIIEDAACVILSCVNTAESKQEEEELEKLADKLQDLRPHSQWKPSDEQMDALHYVTNFDYGGHKATLVSLYEQLKKLKG